MTKIDVEPARAREDATIPPDAPAVECERAGKGQGCLAEVTFTVEEGLPTHVAEVAFEMPDALPDDLKEALIAANRLEVGDRVDEALYEESKERPCVSVSRTRATRLPRCAG